MSCHLFCAKLLPLQTITSTKVILWSIGIAGTLEFWLNTTIFIRWIHFQLPYVNGWHLSILASIYINIYIDKNIFKTIRSFIYISVQVHINMICCTSNYIITPYNIYTNRKGLNIIVTLLNVLRHAMSDWLTHWLIHWLINWFIHSLSKSHLIAFSWSNIVATCDTIIVTPNERYGISNHRQLKDTCNHIPVISLTKDQ